MLLKKIKGARNRCRTEAGQVCVPITTKHSLTSSNGEALISRLSMTAKQSLSPIQSDTTYKVTNSSSSADTLFIISTPFLQSALCKDGVLFYYSYSTAATLKSETVPVPSVFSRFETHETKPGLFQWLPFIVHQLPYIIHMKQRNLVSVSFQ